MEDVRSETQVLQGKTRPKARVTFYARNARAVMSLSLLATDLLMFLLAGVLASQLRHVVLGAMDLKLVQWMPILALVMCAVYAARGLYPAVGLGVVGEFRSLTITTSLFFLITAAASFALHTMNPFSRFVFGLMWFFNLGLIPLGRILTRTLLARSGCWGEPAVLIGPLEEVQKRAEHYRANLKIGLHPQALISPLNQPVSCGLPVYDPRDLRGLTELSHITTAVVLYNTLEELPSLRERYQDTFERVILIKDHDNGLNLSSLSVHEYDGLLSFEIRHNLLDRWAQRQKRAVDVLGAGLGLLLLAPFFALVALLIKLESPGPVFYRQKRFGKRGEVLGMLKFRTMHRDADAMLAAHLAAHPDARVEWDCYQKLRGDPRITRVGVWLRRFSIDELPQLWNVFTGEMSLVGPRPIMLNQRETYGSNLKHYVRVRPGMTGLWQVSGRNRTTFAQRAEFDHHYVMNWSIWLDIYILAKTVLVVLKRDGAC